MSSLTTVRPVSAPVTAKRSWSKYILWSLMAAATISVIFYSEVPLLQKGEEQARLHMLRWILIPHAVAGTIALISGPFQFSTWLRRRHLRFHRVLGRVYIGSVFVAAPLAILSTAYHDFPKAIYFQTAIAVQGGAWFITTAVALWAAMSRRIALHREWVVRSYAVTFTFVLTRVLQPIPAWNRLGRFWFAAAIVIITGLAVLTPQMARGLRWLKAKVIGEPVRTPSSC
jgi:hypothetical protein